MMRLTGVITKIIRAKGFAFILDEAGQERFLHVDDFFDPDDFDRVKTGEMINFEPRRRTGSRGNGLGTRDVRRTDE